MSHRNYICCIKSLMDGVHILVSDYFTHQTNDDSFETMYQVGITRAGKNQGREGVSHYFLQNYEAEKGMQTWYRKTFKQFMTHTFMRRWQQFITKQHSWKQYQIDEHHKRYNGPPHTNFTFIKKNSCLTRSSKDKPRRTAS